MRLIIAEKHSVGQAIAQAIGGHVEKHDGYVQVGDDLVTWAQGHLVDLAAPDEYKTHDWGKWSLDALPIDPTPDWQWKVSRDKGADRQYKVGAATSTYWLTHATPTVRARPSSTESWHMPESPSRCDACGSRAWRRTPSATPSRP